MSDLAALHDQLRPLMFSIAYRMLGSVSEAEDVVQEAFLRMHRAEEQGTTIDSPDAYATTVTTRLAIDALKSARRRREEYVGPWLPEPLLEDPDDPAHRVELDESVSLAFLMLLERLSPTERAVFVLRDVFGYEYADIARIIDRSEVSCRKLLSRARAHVSEARPRFEPSAEKGRSLARRFIAAVRSGDLDDLESLLAHDVMFHADGGGKAPAIREPMSGRQPVARFLLGLARLSAKLDLVIEPASPNGQPGLVVRDRDDAVYGVLALEVVGDEVTGICNQINPDKLRHLGPVGDLAVLLGR